jgi:signal transduction histidine kinase/DNA-binding response OmpR family regulator
MTMDDQATPAGRPASLLVVDDEEELLSVFQEFFEGGEYALQLARTGSEAIARLRAAPFDLVVTDINMPGADGLAVLREAKAVDPACEVIMLTGNASTMTAVEALRQGAYDYITKPFDLFEMEQTIKKALERRLLLAQNQRFVRSLKEANDELLRNQEALRRHRDELRSMVEEATLRIRTLYEVGKEITSSLHLGKTLNLVLERSQQLMGATEGALFLLEENGSGLRCMDGSGVGEEAGAEEGLRRSLAGANERVLAGKQPVMEEITGPDGAPRNCLVVPLLQEGVGIGTVAVLAPPGHTFSPGDQELLASLAAQASIAIHNARVYGKIRDLERMKSEFVAVVSHEVRTPLTSIKGTLELLADDKYFQVDQPQKQLLQICQANADRLEVLINDILDFSKIESSRLSHNFTETAMASLVDNVMVSIAGLAGRKRISLTREVAEDLPPLLADEMRLIQVLNNLLSNAIKFSPEGSEIHLTARRQDEGVLVSIRDQGIGIRQEDLPKLFTRFYQLNSSSTREAGGTGLGLVISKGIIEEHEGRIWAESAPGVGSCFSFWLPLKPHQDYPLGGVPGKTGAVLSV